MTALPPYKQLAREFAAGKIIPFLGAGASTGARPPQANWSESVRDFPPLGSELALALADDCEFPAASDQLKRDLSRVASYYQYASLGRTSLRERLHEIFARAYRPGPAHEFLASTPKGLLIITTNYDTLIEQAFATVNRPYHLVVHPTDRPSAAGKLLVRRADAKDDSFQELPQSKLGLACSPDDATVIYKMHGSIDLSNAGNDQYVITEEDYVNFLGRMTEQSAIPNDFLLPLSERRLLFIGYGLEDWNFRVLLRNLSAVDRTGSTATSADFVHWAIQRFVNDVEYQIWIRQKVNICDMELNEFVSRLKSAAP